MRYMIWNNKGGVGKTFLTYALATEYAMLHPEKDVAVVDLCPQSNVSEMLLGGNGRGEEALNALHKRNLTIAQYVLSRFDSPRSDKLGTELGFFSQVREFNVDMPENLYLLAGDVDLDMCAALIDYLASAPQEGAWARSRRYALDLTEAFEQDRQALGRETVIFYDCNPSFSNYTQLATAAAERLIIPCTADSASIRGVYNVFRLLYGVELCPGHRRHDQNFSTYRVKAREAGFKTPVVHAFVQNKSRSLEEKPTRAYQAHVDEMAALAARALEMNKRLFARPDHEPVFNVKDGNTLVSVVNHTGLPLSKVEAKHYKIYDMEAQVSKTQLERLNGDVAACVAAL